MTQMRQPPRHLKPWHLKTGRRGPTDTPSAGWAAACREPRRSLHSGHLHALVPPCVCGVAHLCNRAFVESLLLL